MALPLLGLAAAALPTIFKGVSGALQLNKANQINPIRPEYKRSNQIREQTAMAYQNAMSNRLAGQSMAENNINRSTQNVISNAQQSAGSSTDLIAAYTAAQANENAAMNDLAGKSAQQQQQHRMALSQQLGNEANFVDKEWDYNKRKKYEEEAAAKAALEGSGRQNLFGAASDIGSFGMSTMGGSGMLDDLFAGFKKRRAAKQQGGTMPNLLNVAGTYDTSVGYDGF